MARKVAVKKTMQDLLISKGYTNTSQAMEYLRGKTVVLNIGCAYGAKGDRIKIDGTFYGSSGAINGGYIYGTNGASLYFRYMCQPAQTIEELNNEIADNNKAIKDLEEENEVIKSKIEFMQNNTLDEYDEEVFKTYEVLKQLNKKASDIDKAKIIAKIIRG